VKSSLREPEVPGDLLRVIFGNVTEPTAINRAGCRRGRRPHQRRFGCATSALRHRNLNIRAVNDRAIEM
jgi:hypothetical protein